MSPLHIYSFLPESCSPSLQDFAGHPGSGLLTSTSDPGPRAGQQNSATGLGLWEVVRLPCLTGSVPWPGGRLGQGSELSLGLATSQQWRVPAWPPLATRVWGEAFPHLQTGTLPPSSSVPRSPCPGACGPPGGKSAHFSLVPCHFFISDAEELWVPPHVAGWGLDSACAMTPKDRSQKRGQELCSPSGAVPLGLQVATELG